MIDFSLECVSTKMTCSAKLLYIVCKWFFKFFLYQLFDSCAFFLIQTSHLLNTMFVKCKCCVLNEDIWWDCAPSLGQHGMWMGKWETKNSQCSCWLGRWNCWLHTGVWCKSQTIILVSCFMSLIQFWELFVRFHLVTSTRDESVYWCYIAIRLHTLYNESFLVLGLLLWPLRLPQCWDTMQHLNFEQWWNFSHGVLCAISTQNWKIMLYSGQTSQK